MSEERAEVGSSAAVAKSETGERGESGAGPSASEADFERRNGGAARSLRVADKINRDLDRALARRTTTLGTTQRAFEDRAKRGGAKLWLALKRHPYAGVGLAAATGVALAASVGVGELAIGAALGYAAFNVLARGESPDRAAQQLAQEIEATGV